MYMHEIVHTFAGSNVVVRKVSDNGINIFRHIQPTKKKSIVR